MTKDEFIAKLVREYGAWCSTTERRESSWWCSLQDFAAVEFNRAYELEKAND